MAIGFGGGRAAHEPDRFRPASQRVSADPPSDPLTRQQGEHCSAFVRHYRPQLTRLWSAVLNSHSRYGPSMCAQTGRNVTDCWEHPMIAGRGLLRPGTVHQPKDPRRHPRCRTDNSRRLQVSAFQCRSVRTRHDRRWMNSSSSTIVGTLTDTAGSNTTRLPTSASLANSMIRHRFKPGTG